MCGRINTPGTYEILKVYELDFLGEPANVNLNAAPTTLVPVITNDKPKELQYKVWSLIPFYSKTGKADFKMPTFNAKIERLTESRSMWQPLVGKKHCVLITNGFYEWNWLDEKGKKKQPYYIKSAGSPFTLMAGLWEDWTNKETGEIVSSCTVITQPANPLMAQIHNTKSRMPAFLTDDTAKLWLDDELSPEERIKVIEPVPDEFLQTVQIKKVGDEVEFNNLNFC